ncbi:hypothetical protein GCM10009733_014840 [Nonomuraea maheshkhaliensis]|uniref:FAS1 domain-containing protein n=1 Tax=Nonomuraea maheshkhaliensis TaxID=419590 RepID=A0ABP4QWK0_9ACTN
MLALAALLPPTSSNTWLPESATEWMPSASIEDDPVKNAATNLATAMAKFADNAAMIAFVPPLALTDLLHS